MRRIVLQYLLALVPSLAFAQQIHTSLAVPIGSIKQWIKIDAADSTRPVLLFLHGGPGNSAMSYASRFTEELQKYFVIVLWDQRRTGKTAQLNSSAESPSLETMENDVLEMIGYLKSRFSREKIFLMGHSWGGYLALSTASHHPELLEACLAVSPMIHQVESERLTLEWLKENFSANSEAMADLNQVSIPFGNADQLYFHRKWLARKWHTQIPSKAFVTQWAKTWWGVYTAASKVNFQTEAPAILCPIYFFIGRNDYQTHFKLAEAYYQSLKADKKQLFWFDDSGHNLILTESKKFQDIVIREIAPK